MCFFLYFCKQKTAYGMRISDWSSHVCSSDLESGRHRVVPEVGERVDGEVVVEADVAQGLARSDKSSGQSETLNTNLVGLPVARAGPRSEERREGKECGSPCRSRWSPSR